MNSYEAKQNVQITVDEEVHLWSASMPDLEITLHIFKSILSKDELKRAGSYKFSKDSNRFIIARGILRCLLSRYLSVPPKKVEFIYGQWGKPKLDKKFCSLKFNLSHSRDYALYAVTKYHEVGIDIEYIDKNFKANDVASNIFSPQEFKKWDKLPYNEKICTFFREWTCKEAYMKAYGKGWFTEDTLIMNPTLNDEVKRNRYQWNANSKYPQIIDLVPNYSSALFVLGPILRPIYRIWKLDEMS